MPKTIFVVDDEPDVTDELELWLSDYGYHVETANGGIEAIEKLQKLRPHLILLDMIMPDLDGLEVLSKLKRNQRTANIPIVMLTAKSETGSILDAKELKASDYVTKPFVADELLKIIRKNEL